MPQSQRLPSVIPFAAIERPACPKCKAPMMLVSIEPARARASTCIRSNALSAIRYLRPLPRLKTPRSPGASDAGFKAICTQRSKVRLGATGAIGGPSAQNRASPPGFPGGSRDA